MAVITGNVTLKNNEVVAGLFNQIINTETYADNIAKGRRLIDRFMTEVGMFGDRKVYLATDALFPYDWESTGASSLLTEMTPPDIKKEEIIIDKFKQIGVTIYPYMSKRAFNDEGKYGAFTGIVLSWLIDTKEIYVEKLFNTYVGTVETGSTVNHIEVDLPTGATNPVEKEAENRLQALIIGESIANLMTNLGDVGRDYNEFGSMRSYKPDDFVIVINSKHYNKIRKVDLPTIFHNEGVIGITEDDIYVLPESYFGTKSTATTSVAGTRTLDARIIGTGKYFPGAVIPTGTTVVANSTYVPDNKIIAKVIHKRAIPYMQSFTVGTAFFDGQKLRENNWLTFGHNTLDYLRNYPVITIKAK